MEEFESRIQKIEDSLKKQKAEKVQFQERLVQLQEKLAINVELLAKVSQVVILLKKEQDRVSGGVEGNLSSESQNGIPKNCYVSTGISNHHLDPEEQLVEMKTTMKDFSSQVTSIGHEIEGLKKLLGDLKIAVNDMGSSTHFSDTSIKEADPQSKSNSPDQSTRSEEDESQEKEGTSFLPPNYSCFAEAIQFDSTLEDSNISEMFVDTYSAIKKYLPEVLFADDIKKKGLGRKVLARKDFSWKGLISTLGSSKLSLEDSPDLILKKVINIQETLLENGISHTKWFFLIKTICMHLHQIRQVSACKNHDELICFFFLPFNFKSYRNTALRNVLTYNGNTEDIKLYYVKWIFIAKTNASVTDSFEVIQRHMIDNLGETPYAIAIKKAERATDIDELLAVAAIDLGSTPFKRDLRLGSGLYGYRK